MYLVPFASGLPTVGYEKVVSTSFQILLNAATGIWPLSCAKRDLDNTHQGHEYNQGILNALKQYVHQSEFKTSSPH